MEYPPTEMSEDEQRAIEATREREQAEFVRALQTQYDNEIDPQIAHAETERKETSGYVTSAIGDAVPIPPLITLIVSYAVAPFVGELSTVFESSGATDQTLDFAASLTRSLSHAGVLLITNTNRHIVQSLDVSSLLTAPAGRTVSSPPLRLVPLPGTFTASNSPVFDNPRGICVDPTRPTRVFVGDSISVRCIEDGVVTHVAGARERSGWGAATATAPAAETVKFSTIHGLGIDGDGSRLFVSEFGIGIVHVIDVKSLPGTVTSRLEYTPPAGSQDAIRLAAARHMGGSSESPFGGPQGMDFAYRSGAESTSGKRHEWMYFACLNGLYKVRLSDLLVTKIVLRASSDTDAVRSRLAQLRPSGVACTPAGTLVVSSHDHCVYTVEPESGMTERLSGRGMRVPKDGPSFAVGGFGLPSSVVLHADSQSVFISDQLSSSIRRLTLPPRLFVAPKLSTAFNTSA